MGDAKLVKKTRDALFPAGISAKKSAVAQTSASQLKEKNAAQKDASIV